jgi:hypothetical protein
MGGDVQTLVVEVADLDGGSYPVRVLVDDGRADWITAPLAQASIPGELRPSAALSAGDAPTPPQAIRETFLGSTDESPVFAQLGGYLGELVVRGDVRAVLEEHARRFPGEGQGEEGLRLLFCVHPVELRRLPWELIRWKAGPLPAFADERNPCARLHALQVPAAAPDTCWPVLRVLVVVGALDEEVESAAEIARIRGALVRHTGFVDVDVCHRPSRPALAALCRERRPHILHFIGHGTSGALEFAPEGDREGWSWGAAQLARDLQGWIPRLVVLNACRSAEINDQSGTWDLVDALFEIGVPAIVGMQGDVEGAAAAAFGGALYRALVNGRSIEAAVAMARNEMSYVVPFESRDVWLPTLTLAAAPGHVLPRRYGVSHEECQTIVDAFKEHHGCEIYAFVDRAQPRRTLWRGIGVEPAGPQRGGALAIVGPPKVGKSALAKWCVGAIALRGGNAAYVPLAGRPTLAAAELLGIVAEALVDSDLHREANEAAFGEYVDHLDRLQGDPAPAGGEPWGPRRYQRTLKPGSETIVSDVFQAFKVALDRAAGDQEIVIAIDDPGVVDPAYWDTYVAPLLLAPIAGRTLPVRLILVAERPVYERLVEPRMRARVPAIVLDTLPPADFVALAKEHLAACGFDTDDLGSLVEDLGGRLERTGRRWDGEIFQLLRQLATTSGAEPEAWTTTP